MIWIIIILAVALLAETWFLTVGFRDRLDPSRQEILDEYWVEFIDWIQDARTIRNLRPPYDVYTDTTQSTPRNVAFITDNNFWLWYTEVKWEKKGATERTKARAARKNNL